MEKKEVMQVWLRKHGKLKLVREFAKKIAHVKIQILRAGIWACQAGAIFTRRKGLEIIESAIASNKAPADGYRLIEAAESMSAAQRLATVLPPEEEIDSIERSIMHFVIADPEIPWSKAALFQTLKGVSRPGIRKAVENLLADKSLIFIGKGMHPWPCEPMRGKRRKRKSRLSDRTKRLKRLGKQHEHESSDEDVQHRRTGRTTGNKRSKKRSKGAR